MKMLACVCVYEITLMAILIYEIGLSLKWWTMALKYDIRILSKFVCVYYLIARHYFYSSSKMFNNGNHEITATTKTTVTTMTNIVTLLLKKNIIDNII